jgi:hypothetical protein
MGSDSLRYKAIARPPKRDDAREYAKDHRERGDYGWILYELCHESTDLWAAA